MKKLVLINLILVCTLKCIFGQSHYSLPNNKVSPVIVKPDVLGSWYVRSNKCGTIYNVTKYSFDCNLKIISMNVEKRRFLGLFTMSQRGHILAQSYAYIVGTVNAENSIDPVSLIEELGGGSSGDAVIDSFTKAISAISTANSEHPSEIKKNYKVCLLYTSPSPRD